VAAGEGHPLRVVAGTGADELALIRVAGPDLAHGIEGPAQLVAADGGQILALQPDLGLVAGRQKSFRCKGVSGNSVAQGGGGLAGGIGKAGS
jgi:hypothetical protein